MLAFDRMPMTHSLKNHRLKNHRRTLFLAATLLASPLLAISGPAAAASDTQSSLATTLPGIPPQAATATKPDLSALRQAVTAAPQDAAALLHLATATFAAGQYGEAAYVFQRLLDLTRQQAAGMPSERDLRLDRVLALTRSGDQDAAGKLLDATLHQFADDPLVLLFAADRLIATGKPKEAEPLVKRALDLGGPDADAYNTQGRAYYDEERDLDALAAFRHALELDDARAQLWVNRALALRLLGRPDEAIADLDQAIKLQADNGGAYYWLGQLTDRNCTTADGRNLADQAARYAPDDSAILYNDGWCKGQHDDWAAALAPLTRAAALNPEDAGTVYELATAQYNLDKFSDAATDFAKAAKLDPKDERAAYWWGRSLARIDGDQAVIEAAYRSAIERSPDYLEPHVSLGQLLGKLGREDEAMAQFALAERIDGKNEWVYNAKGWALLRLKHPDAAAEAFKKAIELDPNDGNNYLSLADLALDRADAATALANYQLAVDHGVKTAETFARLGNLQYQAGRFAEAYQSYVKAHAKAPNEPAYLLRYCLMLALQHETDQAANSFRQALATRPDLAEAVIKQALAVPPAEKALLTPFATALNRRQNFVAAEKAAREAIAVDDKDAAAWHQLGIALEWQKRQSEAIGAYQQAIKLAPDQPDAYGDLGQLLMDQGASDKAADMLRQAIAHQSKRLLDFNALADLLLEQYKYGEAEGIQQQAIALAPQAVEQQIRLAHLQLRQEHLDAAQVSIKAALSLANNMDRADLHAVQGELAFYRKDWQLAADESTRASALDPKNPLNFAVAGDALLHLRQNHQALVSLQKAVALAPDDVAALTALLRAQYRLRLYADADATITHLIRLKPNDPFIENIQGYVLLHEGKIAAANDLFRLVITQAPQHANAYQSLGDGLRAAGQLDAAEDANRQALKLDANFAGAWRGLGDIASDRKDWATAITDYRKAIDLKSTEADTYQGLAIALREAGRTAEAAQVETQLAQLAATLQ
jgi:tetratricopeptide (TPR) repeat protein